MAQRTVSVVLQAEVGQYVSGMTKAAVATKSVGESAATTARKSKSGFDLAGRGAVLFGAAAAGALVGVVAKSMDFEKAMSGIQAATQASATTIGQFREAAMQAGADTQYSATEAANAITEMAKAGVSAKDIMGGGLRGALSLAAAGQLDVAEAAGIASVAMTQFNLQGSDLPHVADLLAAGAGKAMGSVTDLGAALNQSGLIASAAGLSIEETTGVLSAFASAGLMGSDAGTSFKTMLQRLQAPSGEAAELMEQLGINMYDAQGNMLGAAEMAGQLQGGLSGLTEEQRNSALATIFGSDAVRAANVLYKEGTAGIAEWTTKVNDAGYAQKQAAALTDNLAGDLERLGGSFDTLLITIGSGLQGPLRELTQMLGGLVDGVGGAIEVFGDLPGPVQAGIAAMAGWAVAGDKITGVVDGVKGRVRGFREELALQQALLSAQSTTLSDADRALGGLGDSAERTGKRFGVAKAAIGGFARAIGPELGMAAAAYVISSVVDTLGRLASAGDAARDQVADLNKALDGNFGAEHVEVATQNIEALRQAIADTRSEMEQTASAGEFLSSAFNPLAFGDWTASAKDAQASLETYREALRRAEEQQRAMQGTAETLGAYFDLTADDVLDLATKYKVDLTGGADAAMAAFARALTAEQQQKAGLDGAATSASALTTNLQAVADAADEAKRQTDLFRTALDALTGDTVSTMEAEMALEDALAAADKAMENLSGSVLDSKGHLDLQSESGRKAADVLLGVRDSGNQLIATMQEQGASEEEVRKKDRELRESFIKTAIQMGIGRDEAKKLADQILGVPKERSTRFESNADDVKARVGLLQREIDGLHGKTVTITVAANRGALELFRQTTNPNAAISIQGGRATGGPIYGPGGPTDDRAGLWALSNNEHVWTAKEVAGAGGHAAVEALRANALANGRGRAAGGRINVNFDTDPLEAVATDWFGMVRKAAAQGGVPGSGSLSGSWLSIWNAVKSAIPEARINSTYRPGDPGFHGLNKAIDFGFGSGPGGLGSAGLASINRFLHDNYGGSLAELIYDGIGDDRPDLKYGRPLDYGPATRAEHRNHVHAAVRDWGGPVYPGLNMIWNGTGKNEWVSRERPGLGGSGGGSAGGVTVHARVFVGSREITDIARVEAEAVVVGALDAQFNDGQY